MSNDFFQYTAHIYRFICICSRQILWKAKRTHKNTVNYIVYVVSDNISKRSWKFTFSLKTSYFIYTEKQISSFLGFLLTCYATQRVAYTEQRISNMFFTVLLISIFLLFFSFVCVFFSLFIVFTLQFHLFSLFFDSHIAHFALTFNFYEDKNRIQ